MPDVYVFPPVDLAAYENTIDSPLSISYGIDGAARGSQVKANRVVYNAEVSGIGADGNGAGYIEALKVLLKGKLPLVRVETLPTHWWRRAQDRGALDSQPISWVHNGQPLRWRHRGEELIWRDRPEINGVPGNDGAFDFVDVTGIPEGTSVYPGEAVQSGDANALVLRPTTFGAEVTRLFLTGPLPAGSLTIGKPVSRNFLIQRWPSTMQTSGAFSYSFEMKEVFDADYADPLTVLDPWT